MIWGCRFIGQSILGEEGLNQTPRESHLSVFVFCICRFVGHSEHLSSLVKSDWIKPQEKVTCLFLSFAYAGSLVRASFKFSKEGLNQTLWVAHIFWKYWFKLHWSKKSDWIKPQEKHTCLFSALAYAGSLVSASLVKRDWMDISRLFRLQAALQDGPSQVLWRTIINNYA